MITIPLPWKSPPLTLNQRMHWATKARETARIRSIVALLAKGLTINPPIEVELVWTVPDRRRRDVDNPASTVKVCVDALRDAGVIADDHSRIVVRSGTRIEFGTPRSMRLEIRSIP